MCVDFDAEAEVGMEEESVPEFRKPIVRVKEKVDVAERKVVRQGAERVAADRPPPALRILDRPLSAQSGLRRRCWGGHGGHGEVVKEHVDA